MIILDIGLKHKDIVSTECDRCHTKHNIRYSGYLRSIRINRGVYICHGCKVKGGPIRDFVCPYCSSHFELTTARYNNHNSKIRFCSAGCSKAYQKLLYADLRKRGKRCSRCGLVKSIDEFGKCAPGRKKRLNKLRNRCHTCRAKYRMVYSNRVKMKCVKYLGGKCLKCGVIAGMAPPALHPIAFDFHHRNPDEKDFNITKCGKRWQQLKPELDKCDLLCTICHRLEHLKADNWEDYDTICLSLTEIQA